MSIDTTTRPFPHLSVEAETADRLFLEARTAREFAAADVADEQVRAVYDLVKYGPTAMNTVPMRLLVVRSEQARERLVAHMAEGNRERVVAAPLSIVVAYDPAFHEHMDRLFPHVPGMRDKLAGNPEQRSAMARDNALLQAGYLIVGLRAAGLATGPMNGMDHAGIDGEFFAENGWRSLMVVNVGPTEGSGTSHPRGERLSFDEASQTV
ncbi:malonic semialdehyde reductase [Ruania alkalisoli]|uniref:Malonic semialdehyde reductase n=1 Tax=Ruania alkalisoli TaxID=2779775 RepID=A0A7M1SXM5_9MICO|nr:malonic semialdehyde reductase [Ruania alkalisoli]QOR71777.1 malonic semialdehyde reductase [Ruania alkalisoli]